MFTLRTRPNTELLKDKGMKGGTEEAQKGVYIV